MKGRTVPYLKLAALPLGLAVAALSACSFEAGPTVSGEALAEAAEDAVESESGERPDIDCGDDDIIASQDKEVDCVASDPATGAEYDAVVTFTGVDGDTWNIAVEMRTDEESTAQPAEETGAPAEDSGEQAGSGEAIPAASIAEAAADALEAEVGSRPDIDCGDVDIVPENGRTVYCTLTDPADGAEYETTVTFTGVEGDTWSVDVSVASEPK
ncbi:DUF4333 domain-containing protein [Glycomyces tenuis]|uniref:DUF4333 domain-containing protein n=1 Tax=Glycomyces tenuis TaxID=58116 RepID=UPI00047A97EF|nr:DUF4333 domain-containing protein [Glycomyces tenuis]